jgi:exportin-1
MFEYKDFGAFKQHMRDFLVQTKQFADKDNADLFAEETEKQREACRRSPPEHSLCRLRNGPRFSL